MSSGGSNYSTGMTGGGNQVRIDSPASQQNGYGSAPAPGGKGGFPSAQSPYQQQPSVYMPPSQPSFYQQAFTQPRMEAPPRQYGLGGMGNAYARPAVMPDRRYAVGATPSMPGLMPDTYPTRAPPVDEMRFVPAVMPDIQPSALREVSAGPDGFMPGQLPSDSWGSRRLRNTIPNQEPPVEATRAVMPEPNYSGGLGSLFGGMSGSVPYPSSPSPSGFGPLQQQNPQPYGYYNGLWNA